MRFGLVHRIMTDALAALGVIAVVNTAGMTPWTTGFVLAGSLGFLGSAIVGDRRNSVVALAIVVVSYPVFRLMRQPVPLPSADPYVSE